MSHKEAIQLNINSFNKVTDQYDQRESTIVLSEIIPQLILDYNQDIFKGKLLDFGCGTGIVTQRFGPYFDSITGIDINEKFLSIFNKRIDGKSYLIDILEPQDLSYLEGQFDVIICTITYHHLENYEAITKKLATFLNKNGYLFIVDFYNPDVENLTTSKVNDAVRHMGGLKKSSLTNTLQAAGLNHVDINISPDIELWQQSAFIENHCSEEILNKLSNKELECKISDMGVLYKIPVSLVMAVGRK